METAVAAGAESEETVRILKDIRDEIRHARNELRDEIRGVRTERVDRPEPGRRVRAALVVLGMGVCWRFRVRLLFSGARARDGQQRAEGSPSRSRERPRRCRRSAPPRGCCAGCRGVRPGRGCGDHDRAGDAVPPAVAPQAAAVAAPKRAPVRHKVRPPVEAELEEPAKL